MSTLLERLKARGPRSPEELARNEDSVMASIDAQREALNARFDTHEEPEPVQRRVRRPLPFTERDITRAIAGHMKAGLSVAGTKVDRTGFTVLTGQPERVDLAPNDQQTADEWE